LVNINELQIQEPQRPRFDLAVLPDEIELKANGEKFAPATVVEVTDASTKITKTVRKTAGLLIYFDTRDGKALTQKYSKMSATVLKDAMKKLKLTSTEDLQQGWFKYRKTPMTMGNPRLIPFEKLKA
jgi:protein involved in temperature-dependent protein secretion